MQAQGTLTVHSGGAAPTTGAISGRITGTHGHPPAGVAVAALECGCAGGPEVASATTASGGTSTLTEVPPSSRYGVCFEPSNATGGISDTASASARSAAAHAKAATLRPIWRLNS